MAEYLSDRDIRRINEDRVREEIETLREVIDNKKKKKELDELLQQEDTKAEKNDGLFSVYFDPNC